DAGRLYYNYNWSQLHADLVPPNYLNRNPNHNPTSGIDHGLTLERKIYPIRANQAVNRGYVPGTLDTEGKLLEFASACSPFIYRGDLLPASYLGNAFVCEPTANLIKRNLITENNHLLEAKSAREGVEFLASTDERFRPIFLASGPDGALYIADMYRGIIQHGPYMTPYLREVTLNRELDKYINMGRIWRIIPKDKPNKPASQPFEDLSVEALVNQLNHPNGWHRDMAQRLLVEKQDAEAIPLLRDLLFRGEDYRTRLQALWTLEGLSHKNAETFIRALDDPNPQVQIAAIRMIEKLAINELQLQVFLWQKLSDKIDQTPP
ncbi:MAG: dehydrogenase, partial [Bacteroidetes bacterium]|nr:dehydrogenase [Bacteroidota bacterium]